MLDSFLSLWRLWAVALACWLLCKGANVYIAYRKRTRRV